MRKNLIKILTVIVICCFSAFIVACNNGGQSQNEEKPTITLNSNSINLILGDSAQLQAVYSQEDWVKFVWESSNKDIAIVDENGKVSAVGVGETKIAAKYNDLTAYCSVVVNVGNLVPTLYKTHGFSNQITACIGSEYQLSYAVSFNKNTYNNGAFTFSSSDESSVSVDKNGKITVKKLTDEVVKITVKGEWLGKEYPTLYEVIEVKVVDDVTILVDDGSTGKIKLYAISEHNGNTYPVTKDLKIEVIHNGQKVNESAYTVNIADGGENVAKFEDGKVSTVAYGNTGLIITYGDVVKEIPIEVERPVSKYNGNAFDFSAYNGKLDLDKIFDKENVQLVDAMQGDNVLTITDNAVFGLNLERDKLTQTSVTLLDDKEGFIVDLTAAYARVKTAEDLQVLDIKSGTDKSNNLNGYVVLENDIVLDEPLTHSGVDTTGYYLSSQVGFAGVFDGNGFKITAPIDRAGFFGAMVANTEDAQTIIKNVRLDLTVQLSNGGRDSKDHAAGLFYLVGNMSAKNRLTVQDVYLKVSGRVGDFSGVCAYDTYCLDYKNVTVDLSDLISQKGYVFGRIDGYVARGLATQREGIIVISDMPYATTQTGLENVPSNLIYYAQNEFDVAIGTEYDVKVQIDNTLQYKINADGAKQYQNYKQLKDAGDDLIQIQPNDGYELLIDNEYLEINEQATVSLVKNGNNKAFTLYSSNGCVSCDGNILKANYDGASLITATYEINGIACSRYLVVCVGAGQLTIRDYNTEQTPYIFSVLDGDMPSDMLTDGETIMRAVADKQTLTVENNKVKGFTLPVDDKGRDLATNALISIYTNKSNQYKVYVTAYTKTIDSAEDMLHFNLSTEKTLTGTYKMTKNVQVTESIASQITHDVVPNSLSIVGSDTATPTYGFKGTFDGDGYTLSGYIPTKGYFGSVIFYGIIKNVAIDAQPYVTDGTINAVFALTGGSSAWSQEVTMTDVSVKVSGTVNNFAGLFGRASFLTTDSIFVDLSELTANKGYALSSRVFTGYFRKTNVYVISTLPIAKSSHWTDGVMIASNADISGKTILNDSKLIYYFMLNNVEQCIFDGTEDNSATYAKGVLYADLVTLLANQKSADSYTGYGSTGAQFANSTYWKMTETTVGGITGYVPKWINK